MPAAYLLDTNIVSYFIEGRPPAVRHHVEVIGMDATAISTITEAELRFGLANKPAAARHRIAVESYLANAEILSWDSPAAQTYAHLRAEQKAKGRMLSTEDLMIASHALSLGLTLVTADRAFSFIAGLRIEDWTTH